MRNERGQATILVGIIFQLVFIFFAMVINVGLLINDKINLQNSVDIAAYYGAMKQAEVLNTMAHVNYQIRQTWKLFNWRLWALGDMGRNTVYQNSHNDIQQFVSQMTSLDESMAPIANNRGDYPIVCVRHQFWTEEFPAHENFCQKDLGTVPPLIPMRLGPFQRLGMFALTPLQVVSNKNALNFKNDCNRGPEINLFYATMILASYKNVVASKRGAMRNLQNLLIGQGQGDFKDISGNSVAQTVNTVFKKNLTLANKTSIDDGSGEIQFFNSVGGQSFIVPIDVRTQLIFEDIWSDGRGCHAQPAEFVQNSLQRPSKQAQDLFKVGLQLSQLDYTNIPSPQSADTFKNASPVDDFRETRSLVGFEKNPWISLYVKVSASTKPKMLFSPIGDTRVTLSAEAYAMPFGGKIGPWYSTTWPKNASSSDITGAQPIDGLLPPRLGAPPNNVTVFTPNYSRFPGDTLGMKSGLARIQGFDALVRAPSGGYASLAGTDYGNLVQTIQQGQPPAIDPLANVAQNPPSPVRQAELIAIAPDVFDATYYSINDRFFPEVTNYSRSQGQSQFYSQICPYGCEDLGNSVPISSYSGMTIGLHDPLSPGQDQISITTSSPNSKALFWKITNPDHLHTGWSHTLPSDYNPDVDKSVIGASGPNSGRSGYSVKIVSKKYLQGSVPDLGGPGQDGVISNSP